MVNNNERDTYEKKKISMFAIVIILFAVGFFLDDNQVIAAVLDENIIVGTCEYSLSNSIAKFGVANTQQTREKSYAGIELTDEFYFYRGTLSDNSKKVYEEIKQGVLKGKKTISITAFILKDEIGEVYLAVIYDNPELFWAEPGFSYTYSPVINNVLSLMPKYNDLVDDIEGSVKRVEDNTDPNYYRYKYFNITDEEMLKDHTRDEWSGKKTDKD